MFITTLPALLRLLGYAFLLGVSLGVLYDGFRIFKVAVLGGTHPKKEERHSKKRRSAGKETQKAENIKKSSVKSAGEKPKGKKRQKMPRESGKERSVFFGIPEFLLHFVSDLLFFLLAAVVTVIFMYAFHRGKLRLGAVAALALGFFAYYCTVGKLVYSLTERIVAAVRRAIRFAFSHTLLPLGRLLKRLFTSLFAAIYRLGLQKKRRAASKKEEERILKLAKQGFGVDEESLLRL